MNKNQIDELYHQLRLLYLSNDEEQKQAVYGLVSHLSTPYKHDGDYTGLLHFLTWYGENFLVGQVFSVIRGSRLKFSRVVELGAGLGWLGRAVAHEFGDIPALFIDKRQWPFIDIVADIESTNGRQRVIDALKPGDLIVMSELLHCLEYPAEVMLPYSSYPIVAVEYFPKEAIEGAVAYKKSYNDQISKLGCTLIVDFGKVFPRSMRREFSAFPHTIVVAEPM